LLRAHPFGVPRADKLPAVLACGDFRRATLLSRASLLASAAILQPLKQGGNTMSKTKPAAKLQLFPVTAVVWRNETPKGDTVYSVTVERSYKDADGNWKISASLNESDLLLAAKALDLAHTEIVKLRAADRKSQQPEGQPEEEAA
jgi:hypothetical protein